MVTIKRECLDESAGVALVRQFGSVKVRARAEDRYVNATDLAKAASKKWSDYARLDGTEEFIQALAQSTGIPADQLVQAKSGNSGGTWVHPRVVIHFAQWASPEFAVAVSGWALELLTTGRVELPGAAAHEVEMVRGELAQVQNRLDAMPAVLASAVAQALADVFARRDLTPLAGTETVASRLGKLLPHWNTTAEQRALIRNRARANVRRALGQEPLCVHAGSQLEFTPNMVYHLDTAIYQTYRQALRENEVDDFGLYADCDAA